MTSDTELFTGPDCQKLMSKGVELLRLFSTKAAFTALRTIAFKFGLPFDAEHFQKPSKNQETLR